jgi:hypothetical protein
MKTNPLSLFILTLLAKVASAQAQNYSYRIVDFPRFGTVRRGLSGAVCLWSMDGLLMVRV